MLKTEVNSTALISETAIRPSSSTNLTEIAGYRLLERIGVGGFGEVWKAIGPGGFPKAVKILFGSLSGPQAETEMRSLNRIRELRHPFLLSVERVEVVDGRVVIVTELADRSLEDRFKEAVASGQKGIPRDELIGYLRDAADALDFMSEQHDLQHLDVKPDNLLLQGSHAKVGDFGLTKSLSAAGHSLVNGFTPLYAPPELFDGRPERGSDQYSLAILYQTMLTGIPPFNGRSSTQLMSQHLKSTPDVSSLHPSDRAVVARALSKTPRTRFASCRQFVDELSRRRYANSSLPRTAEVQEPQSLNPLTEFVVNGTVGLNKSQLMPPAAPLRPPGTAGMTWQVRPTVFIAIGGMGTQVVTLLRDRLETQFPGATLPAMQFLCIDSDVSFLQTIERAFQASTTLTTIGIPLKTSHEYRKTPGDHLNWLSRRWLFNIPRSGKVEGMRPLGRLAFVDHQNTIRTQLQKSIDQIIQSEACSKSHEESQLPFTRDGLDFVLVGSTSGGTCSGSLFDVATQLRQMITERRLPPCTVSAVLMHATGNSPQTADTQDANTISFLKELNYFSLPGVQRPGAQNRSGDLGESANPLDEAVLLHMGDDLTSLDFNTGITTATDYLELRSLTPARLEMDSWRKDTATETENQGMFSLRTFGLARVACDTWEVASAEASLLASAAIRNWLTAKVGVETSVPAGFEGILNDLSLSGDAIVNLVPRLLNQERTRRVDEYASTIWSRLGAISSPGEMPGHVAALISQETTSLAQKSAIATVIEDIRKDLAAGSARSLSKIVTYLGSCVDGKGHLLSGDQALTHLVAAIDEAITTSARQKSDLQAAFSELCSSFSNQTPIGPEGVDGNTLKAFCRQYCMLLVCQTACQNVAVHLKNLRESVGRLRDDLIGNLRTQLHSLLIVVQGEEKNPTMIPQQMLTAFEDFLLKSSRFKLSALVNKELRPSDAALLSSEAANFLFRSFGKPQEPDVTPAVATTDAFPASARPFIRNVGGGQRVVAVLPEQIPGEPWKVQIQREFGACVSVCPMNRKDISVVCEVEGIAISSVVDVLSNLKPRVVELAGRVHSRQDVPW